MACIDSDASITITTVARSRGTSTSVLGRANAAVRVTRLSSDSATARCRRHWDCFGTTTSSIEVLVNRMPRRFFRRVAKMYAATSSGMTSRMSSRSGDRNASWAPGQRDHFVTPWGGACSMLATRR